MKKSYKLLLLLGVVLFIAGFFIWYFKPGKEPEKAEQSLMMDVPDAEAEGLPQSKSDAYRKESGKKDSRYDDYFESLISDDGSEQQNDISLVSDDSPRKPESSEDRVAKLLGVEDKKEEPVVTRGGSGGGTPRPKPAPKKTQPEPAPATTTDEKFVQDMERARLIAAAINGQEMPAQDGTVNASSAATEKIVASQTPRRSGIISSLDDDSSWEEPFVEDEYEPAIKCMFIRDERVKNGQRVTVRTLQEFMVGDRVVPANSHLSATCSLDQRLNLTISSIELNGVIISLDYEAYDFDGNKGIYCPETSTNKGARNAATQAVSTGSSLVGGYVGTIASAVVRTGASLFQSASGENYVNLSSGYEFYIMKKRRS